MPEGIRRQLGEWLRRRSLTLFGLVVLALWVVPALQPVGYYAHCYNIVVLEINIFATVIWLGCVGISLAPPRRRRPLALRLTVAFVAVWFTAAACDVAAVLWMARVRHFWYYGQAFGHDTHIQDPELIWRFRPGFAFKGKSNPFSHDVIFRTDENGFRNPPGVTRADLVFVGDSVTMAAEVDEDATFVQRTARTLGLKGVNLGFFGYGPQQELAVLKRYGFAYQPRAVVWQITEWNDCEDAERYLKRDHPDKPQMTPWLTVYETYSPIARRLAKIFRYRKPESAFELVTFRRSDGLGDNRLIWPLANHARECPAGLEETKRAISAAHALCRERGIAFVVLFVPSHTRVLSPYILSRTVAERARYVAPDGPSALTSALAAHCERLGCPLVDLFGPLRRRAAADNLHLYIKHDPHLDLDGHDEAARQLAARLCAPDVLALQGAPGLRR